MALASSVSRNATLGARWRTRRTRATSLAVRVGAILALGASSLALHATPAHASDPSTPYVPMRIDSPDQPARRWGERLVAASLPGPLGGNPVTAGDLDGDGVNDFWTADPFETIAGNANQGRVFAVSGKTFQVIYRIDAPVLQPNDQAAFGFYISSPGDVNGDGKPDIVVGTDAQNVPVQPGLGGCVNPAAPEPNGCNENQGEAWVFNGVNGTLLYAINNPTPQGSPISSARFGSRIGRAGDINGDGRPDIIIGASNQDVCDTLGCTQAVAAAQATAGTQAAAGDLACGDISPIPAGCAQNQGQAFIFSGANGALLRTIDLPAGDQVPTLTTSCTANCGNLGLAVQSPGDLNGDGVPDQQVDASNLTVGGMAGQGRVYIFNGSNGALLARVDDPVPQAGATFGFQDAAPNSPGDINGDGVPDIYANGFGQDGPQGAGQGRAWIFDGKTTVLTGTSAGHVLVIVDDPTPELGGQFGWSMTTTDYNNDGKADFYVGQSPHHVAGATGSGGTYVFNGPSSANFGTAVLWKALELPGFDFQASTPSNLGPNLGWGLAAPGDLDGDGNQDYLGGAPFKDVKGVQDAGQIFAFESRERPPVANFDGNTTSDISVFRPSTSTWFVQNGTIATFGNSAAGDVPVSADFNGDGVTELATYNVNTGNWVIQGQGTTLWGIPSDVPVPADYDGDGKADIAVFRPSTGQWFVRSSITGTGIVTLWGGTAGDIAVPADYDGDGKADIAIYRPSTGEWFIHGSTGVNTVTTWGITTDIPVPGDYDGDGKVDIAVYRPTTGEWFIHKSSGVNTVVVWGAAGDKPEPGDYDGDGKTDVAVWRNTDSTWYVNGSTGVNRTFVWGVTGDVPLPLPEAIRRALP